MKELDKSTSRTKARVEHTVNKIRPVKFVDRNMTISNIKLLKVSMIALTLKGPVFLRNPGTKWKFPFHNIE